jgi:hypothetical protein
MTDSSCAMVMSFEPRTPKSMEPSRAPEARSKIAWTWRPTSYCETVRRPCERSISSTSTRRLTAARLRPPGVHGSSTATAAVSTGPRLPQTGFDRSVRGSKAPAWSYRSPRGSRRRSGLAARTCMWLAGEPAREMALVLDAATVVPLVVVDLPSIRDT